MNDIVDRIYESGTYGTKKQIKRIILAYQDSLKEDILSGKPVQLTGLCTFSMVHEPEKTRKSFGKEITTPARREVKVKVSHQLKEAVRAS